MRANGFAVYTGISSRWINKKKGVKDGSQFKRLSARVGRCSHELPTQKIREPVVGATNR